MESLPPGANFIRAKLLWEIALHLAADTAAPGTGSREMCIALGSGSQDRFISSLTMATGSPLLAHAIGRGELDVAIVNPSALLTQAYRGTGLFSEPIPLRVLANYPSWDRFVCAIHPRTGLKSIADIKGQRYPLRASIRQDPSHATRILIDQMLAAYDFSLADIESWGGALQRVNRPGDQGRLVGIRDGTLDAVFDEGISTWLEQALSAGMEPVSLEEPALRSLEAIGWRRALIPAGHFSSLRSPHLCIDFGGWPLYTRASLPDEQAYRLCAALQAREAFIVWDERAYTGLSQLGRDTEATPLDVPLHPGAERWYRDQGFV